VAAVVVARALMRYVRGRAATDVFMFVILT
jgi:hypothetical protein